MADRIITLNRAAVEALADRLSARATSRLWDITPEVRSDLLMAVAVIRAALAIGFPIRDIEVSNGALR
jgi:exopolyphosphatase/pppGpp-phosphohydrolase